MRYTRVTGRTWLTTSCANCHSNGPFYISLGCKLTRVARTLIFVYAPCRHASRTARRTQGFRIIVYGLMPEHCYRLAWRGERANACQISHGPSQRTGNLSLHRSVSIGAHR
jgi:hypothetical protein